MLILLLEGYKLTLTLTNANTFKPYYLYIHTYEKYMAVHTNYFQVYQYTNNTDYGVIMRNIFRKM